MWSLVTSAINFLYQLIFRASVVKFVIFTAFFLLLDVLIEFATDLLGLDDLNAQAALDGLSNDLLFYLTVFRLDLGIPAIVAALLVRFTIRRLPIIG